MSECKGGAQRATLKDLLETGPEAPDDGQEGPPEVTFDVPAIGTRVRIAGGLSAFVEAVEAACETEPPEYLGRIRDVIQDALELIDEAIGEKKI